ncbi:helix-turn-helix domain-containing protein [Bacillus cereus]|nr:MULTISPECIES: helix-turn-helix domain-containing protein [Bacillales]AHZ49030.1 hypothetical protein YBT1520_01275 [Bacillus thuringiensis serovar kurstaki str. YBT-1520]AIE31401.1 hypothetical protein BTK_01345 [Bacillus thuringiensis serovar kurstaki str. HD-1]AIM28498.1 hypothetical protein DF16_orf00082 [Bacillus thuringiensis serovar kurstaki str. YBT-1520]AJK41526.1 DNA binding, excisionase family domain protein [Bacillus thuringiensis serovar kurstaki]AKJ59161.1 DNA-binding protein [
MNLKFELPDDTLITSRSDLKSLLRELKEELQEEKMQDDIFTIKEAAEYMKVSIPTVRSLIATNEIPYFKRGQVIRLNRWDILDWMRKDK